MERAPIPIWVTGIGTVTCAGADAESLWENSVHHRSGILEGLGKISNSTLLEIGKTIRSSSFLSPLKSLADQLPDSKAVFLPFFALSEAMENAGWTELNQDDGIIFATTTGQISAWDQALLQFLKKKITEEEFKNSFQHQPLGALLKTILDQVGFRGKSTLISSACNASTQAMGLASLWLKQGRVKRCLVGASEILCDLTIQGFRSLQLLSPEPSTPFDQSRQGINLSEGAGFICLETEPRSTAPLARITGYGFSTDGYHMTSPHPEGQGCLKAMKDALNSAKITPSDISWIHAHGTGSRHNDQAEGQAIHQLFGNESPWTSSTKWVHGHALGASGVIESILCIKAIQHQIILKTGGLKTPDPQIILRHPSQHTPGEIQHILKNTLGFGGTNAAIVISHPNTKV